MKDVTVTGILVVTALLVCWALAELRFAGWRSRRRRIMLLVVLAIGGMVIAHRVTMGY